MASPAQTSELANSSTLDLSEVQSQEWLLTTCDFGAIPDQSDSPVVAVYITLESKPSESVVVSMQCSVSPSINLTESSNEEPTPLISIQGSRKLGSIHSSKSSINSTTLQSKQRKFSETYDSISTPASQNKKSPSGRRTRPKTSFSRTSQQLENFVSSLNFKQIFSDPTAVRRRDTGYAVGPVEAIAQREHPRCVEEYVVERGTFPGISGTRIASHHEAPEPHRGSHGHRGGEVVVVPVARQEHEFGDDSGHQPISIIAGPYGRAISAGQHCVYQVGSPPVPFPQPDCHRHAVFRRQQDVWDVLDRLQGIHC
ncbi:hypothetical protein ACMFMG_012007 [Clarireedia jacksonii]